MRQGEAYRDLEVIITEDELGIDVSLVDEIDFYFGVVTKNYPEEVEYLDGSFYVPLTGEDTKKMGTHTIVQQVILFKSGEQRVSNKKVILVNKILGGR